MTTEFTYAIQPSYLIELTDHCHVAPNWDPLSIAEEAGTRPRT